MAQAIALRRRRVLIGVGVAVVLLFVVLNVLSGFYVDLLWFREVHFSNVFWTVFWSKVLLGFVFGLLFFGLLYANLLIVRRLTPPFRVFTPEQEVIERYRVAVEPYIKWIIPGFALLIALFVGIAASSRWQTFLLWRDSGGITFGGTPDPVFHRDASFYVFRLPFLHFVQGWLFSALVGVTVIVGIAHYLSGGIRTQSPAERVTPQVKVHLSVLLGLIMLVKAWGYYLGQFDLLTSSRGVAQGASYTDVHVQKPALFLLMIVAVICAVIFFVNIRFRGWAAPAIAIGILAVASIVAGAIVPAAVQQFSVKPQELQKEEPFIQHNIDFTRTAFDLNRIGVSAVRPAADISQEEVTQDETTVSNIRLWDPGILQQSYDQLQRIRQFYDFQDVDVDRYQLNGQERMVMVSAREASQANIPGGATWQNQHLVFTHGYGAVASQVNTATTEGQPSFLLRDIPPTGTPDLHIGDVGNRVYYGEGERDVPFVVVNSGADELDFQKDSSQQTAPPYTGQGGIPVGGFFSKMLLAWRFKDVNLLISGLINGNSRVMIFRDIGDRIPKAAPFLQYDGDPYAAIVGGRIVWIQDAYTTTDNFPYSQRVPLGRITDGHLTGEANYIRNSVKVVVDAYDGSITYYVTDPSDPIIQVWGNVFPDLFTPMPADPADPLRAHFRYPEDLFTVQAVQFAKYHVTTPQVFYGNQDLWSLSADPTASQEAALRPYYVLTALPGQTQDTFSLILPFTPAGRNNMVAWMAADSDPENYGEILSFEFPSGENVDGPVQVLNRINSNAEFSSFRTLVGQAGSDLLFGNFLVIPIGDGFLYVEPVFVRSSSTGQFAELKRVLVVHGGSVGFGTTLSTALTASFENQGGNEPPPPSGGSIEQQIQDLLSQAADHFKKADDALQAGDLGTYQKEVQLAEDLVKRADDLAAQLPTGSTPTPTPSSSATPSPSVSPSG
jgi:uncharacterized protein